jgi:hypothetical protein
MHNLLSLGRLHTESMVFLFLNVITHIITHWEKSIQILSPDRALVGAIGSGIAR